MAGKSVPPAPTPTATPVPPTPTPTATPRVEIVAQPQDVMSTNGSATFSVAATTNSSGTITYQWEEGLFLQGNGGMNWTRRNMLPGMFVDELCETNHSGLSEKLSIVYGDGIFVAVVPNSNTAATSPDGINWTQRTLPSTANWRGLSYGNERFVATALNTNITATSTDGINWTQGALPSQPVGSELWGLVAYGNNTFVALASGQLAATSLDGIEWKERIMSSNAVWTGIAYGNGLFVAVSTTAGNTTATSTNGINWTRRALPASADWRSIAYGNGMFVALAYNNNIAATSTDGINWTIRSLPTMANWSAIAVSNGTFAAVACGSNIAATSTDGITWTQRTLPATTSWRGLAYGKKTFMALGASGISATSLDGMEFSPITGETNSTLSLEEITPADAGKRYRVVVSSENAEPVTSREATLSTAAPTVSITQSPQNTTATNGNATFSVTATVNDGADLEYRWESEKWRGGGENWTRRTLPSSSNWESVAYGGGIFLALSRSFSPNSAFTATSTDGINWTQHTLPFSFSSPSDFIYINGTFFAVATQLPTGLGSPPAIAITSVDGVNWTIRDMPLSGWKSVTYGDGLFVAVGGREDGYEDTWGSGYVCAKSTDGVNWTLHPMPEAAGYQSVTYGNGLFVAISGNNDLATSQDGVTWAGRNLPNSDWSYVTYGDGMFVALAGGQLPFDADDIATSQDGITWFGGRLPGSHWQGITYGNGLFVAVSNGNSTSNIAFTSPDGLNWTQRTLPVQANWSGIACGKGTFVAVAYGSDIAATSTGDSLQFLPISGATSPTLNLAELTPEDNGSKYRVIVDAENAKPATSSTATLTAN